MFDNLAPGRYTAYPKVDGYAGGKVTFEVRPGQAARPTIRLRRAVTVTFRLQEKPENKLMGFLWVGYRITKPDGKTPVLEDYQGPLTGGLLYLSDKTPRQASIYLAPGIYRLKAVLRRESGRGVLTSQRDLWSISRLLKVTAGKNIVIEMPRAGP